MKLLFAIFVVSAACLVFALTGHGVSFRVSSIRVSAESVGRLAAVTALAGLSWLVLLARQRHRGTTADLAMPKPLDPSTRRWLVASIVALGVAVAAASLSFRWAPPAYPIGDGAALEIGTLNALHGSQLLGPYSRFGWNHPGPLLFYLLAPWYALSGQHHLALYAASAGLNLSAIIVVAWAAARHGTLFLSVCLAAILTLYVLRCGPLIVDAWNPYVVVLPSAALLALAACVAAGDSVALPALALTASFLGQTHVGLLLYSAVIATTAVVAWAARWRYRNSSHNWRWTLIAVVVLVVAWALPLYEQWSSDVGNLDRLAAFFDGSRDRHQWRVVLSVWAETLTALFRADLRLPIGRHFDPVGDAWFIVIAGVLLALLAIATFAIRRRRPFLAAFGALSLLGAVMALLSVSGIRGEITDYSVFWIAAVGAVNVACLAGSCLETIYPRVRIHAWHAPATAGVFGAAMLISAVLAGSRLADAATAAGTAAMTESAISRLGRAVVSTTGIMGGRRTRLNIAAPVWEEAAGVILDLYKRGVPISVDPGLSIMYGRPLTRERGDVTLWLLDRLLAQQYLEQRKGCVIHQEGAVVIYSMEDTTACRSDAGAVTKS